MCGIIGYSGKQPFNPDRIDKLMLCNMSRGTDATGMLNNGAITKRAVDAIDFLAAERIHPEYTFIGHCRAGTRGSKTDPNNAHPFQYENIVGVHNGTLTTVYDITKLVGWSTIDYTVDSQVIIKCISAGKTVEMFKALDGAAAVIWTDISDPKTIYCYRNNERPLFRGEVEGEGMYLSSIEASLALIGCSKIKEVKIHTIYTITDGQIVDTKTISIPERKAFNSTTSYNSGRTESYGSQGSEFYTKLKRGMWIRNSSSTRDFTIGNWYKVQENPTWSTNTPTVCLYNDLGQRVWRMASFFSVGRATLGKGDFGFIASVMAKDSIVQKGDIFYVISDYTEGLLYCVSITNWSKRFTIKTEYCRGIESNEKEQLDNLLQSYLTAAKSSGDMETGKEVLACIFLSESIKKMDELTQMVDKYQDDLDSMATLQVDTTDVYSKMEEFKTSIDNTKMWMNDEAFFAKKVIEKEDEE